VRAIVKERIRGGAAAAQVVAECNQGMVELGNRFAAGECFIPELMFGGMIMKGVMAELSPLLRQEAAPAQAVGTAVMGSVRHDVHDIGKDIVVMMLRGVGFEVVDLGVDVPPEDFVKAVRRHQPAVMGMSVLLTTCFKSVVATMDALAASGLPKDHPALPLVPKALARMELERLIQVPLVVRVRADERAFAQLLYELQPNPTDPRFQNGGSPSRYFCVRGLHASVKDPRSTVLDATIQVGALFPESQMREQQVPLKEDTGPGPLLPPMKPW
jgi:5-methyltetrahydrofolate--homocysteine methyltransferase